jgi:hypothetical protein
LKAKIETLETPEIDLELSVSSSRIKEVLSPLLLLNPEFKHEINMLARELEEQLSASDPDWQLEQALKDAIIRVQDEVPIGERGSEGVLGSPLEEKEDLHKYMQVKTEKVILRVPLVKLAKIILDNPNPETEELKSLNQKLSKIAKTRLGLKVVKDRKRRSIVEIPWGLAYKPSAPMQPIGTPSIKVIDLDDKHPLEKGPIIVTPKQFSPEENDKRLKVWNALAEASLIRGSAFLDELVQATGLLETDVKAILEQFQKEGKAYSPHLDIWKISEPKEKLHIKVVAWFGLTAKIISWQAWKATEQLHWLKRNLQLDLEFPDDTKIKVTGALTWFLAKLKAFQLFGEWRKNSRLTREGTLPSCIGTGKPIWPNKCEECAKHSDFTCEQLKQMSREYFKKFIKVKYRRFYADVNLYLCETPFRLTPDGQRALWLLVFRYITNHRENKRIYGQYFAITDDYAAFNIVEHDTTSIVEAVIDILTTPENTKRVGRVISVISKEA